MKILQEKMCFPKIKHVNTVGIRYTKEEREYSYYVKIIEVKLLVIQFFKAIIHQWYMS